MLQVQFISSTEEKRQELVFYSLTRNCRDPQRISQAARHDENLKATVESGILAQLFLNTKGPIVDFLIVSRSVEQ